MSPRTLPVTPAERACATVLRAYLALAAHDCLRFADSESNKSTSVMLDLEELCQRHGLIWRGDSTPAGAALLARVEAALDYEQGRRDAIADAAADLDKSGYWLPKRMILENESRLRAARLAGTTPIDAPPAKEPR